MRYKQRKTRSISTIDIDLNGDKNGDKIVANTDDSSDQQIESEIKDNVVDTINGFGDKEAGEQEEEEQKVPNVVNKQKQTTDVFSIDNLVEKITENDKYFSSLIDLIPAKIYFEGNDEILEDMDKRKKSFFGDDLDLSIKSKQKRFKLDPNSDKKVSEIANSFYNKSNKKLNSKQKKSADKMSELKKVLNQKITQLKSVRGQKSNARQLRESKKDRKRLNSMRAHKQKGFAKRQPLEASDDNTAGEQPAHKRNKSEDTTDAPNTPKNSPNLPKIYNTEGNIVYSKFDLATPSDTNNNKKKNKDKLQKLLFKTKKEEQKLSAMEATDAPKAQEIKEKKLWRKAIDLSEGIKVRDKSKLIEKTLNKKKKLKQKSAKKWAERQETLDKSMKSKSDKRQRNIDQRKQQKKDKHINRLKKKGRILDIK